MLSKKDLAGATLLAKVTQIVLCGITFGESYKRLQEYSNCDYVGVTLSTVLITHFAMEILILSVLYFSKPMGIHLTLAKIISIIIVIPICTSFAIYYFYNRPKHYVVPENPEKKMEVPASPLIIILMVAVVIMDAATVYFAAKVSNYISLEIQAEEQGNAPPANDPENAAAGNEPMDAALPNEALPNEALPNEALPNEALPNAALPNAALPNEALPNEALPNEALPNEVLPNEALPNEALPNEALPNEALPNEALPNEGLPNEALPNEALANEEQNGAVPIEPENVPVPYNPENVPLPNESENVFVQNDQQNGVEVPINAGVSNDKEIANVENMHSVDVEDDVELIDQQNALKDKDFNSSTTRLDDLV